MSLDIPGNILGMKEQFSQSGVIRIAKLLNFGSNVIKIGSRDNGSYIIQ